MRQERLQQSGTENLKKCSLLMTHLKFHFAMFFQTQCQMMEQAEEGNEEEDDVEDPDSEASEKLIEYAGDVLPALGNAMTPLEFAPYFAGLLPSILQRTVSLFYFYVFLSINPANDFVCRKSIARLRKNLSAPVSLRCAWNRWMAFWNPLYRISTRPLLP